MTSNHDTTPRYQTLDVYVLMKQFTMRVHAAKISDANIRDQAERAANSAFLRLSEGLPLHAVGMRKKYFTESDGSLCETLAALDLAGTIGWMCPREAAALQIVGERLRRMIRALIRPRAPLDPVS